MYKKIFHNDELKYLLQNKQKRMLKPNKNIRKSIRKL